jgi:hypothetical protein
MQADEMGLGALMIGGAYTVFTGTMLIARPLVGVLLDKLRRRWFFTGAVFFTRWPCLPSRLRMVCKDSTWGVFFRA